MKNCTPEEVLVELVNQWDLPYLPCQIRGGQRVCLSIYPLVNKDLQGKIHNIPFERSYLVQHPTKREDPLGYIAGLNPFLNEDQILDLVDHQISLIFKNPLQYYNPVHLEFLRKTIEISSLLCRNYNVNGVSSIQDAAFLRRIWQQSIHLMYVKNCGSNLIELRDNVVPLDVKRSIHSNWYSSRIVRRKITSLEKRYLRLAAHANERTLRQIIKESINYEEELQKEISDLSDIHFDIYQKPTQFNFKVEQVRFYVCAIPRSQELGEIDFRLIAQKSLQFDLPGAIFVAVIMAVFLRPKDMLSCTLEPFDENYYLLQTKAPSLVSKLPNIEEASLCEDAKGDFCRLIPKSMGDTFEKNRLGKSLREIFLDIHTFLKSISDRYTLSKVLNSLRFAAPHWFNYPPVLAHTGIWNDSGKMPGWQSYINVSPKVFFPQAQEYFKMFNITLPTNLERIPSCGSLFTPRIDVVRKMFSFFPVLLEKEIPSNADAIVMQ